ncbi:MAG: hypothetical protein EA401_14750 [Planctomycetota bacterium]|nr:MAG: hypothetical protein EA401_14750 [Planctomycetota bacterium]
MKKADPFVAPDSKREASARRGQEAPRIAVLGASAGGLQAIEQFMRSCDQLSDDVLASWALVIIQHLSPDHESVMDALLRRCCRMPIVYACSGAVLCGGTCYLIPAHADITWEDGCLNLHTRPGRTQPHHPIDRFSLSLHGATAASAAIIIASGTGSDGALGAYHLAQHQGQVWIQDPHEANFPQMPEAALAQVPQANIGPMPSIPGKLFAQESRADAGQSSSPGSCDEGLEPLDVLAHLLEREHRLHWNHYHAATLMRRLDQGRQTTSSR